MSEFVDKVPKARKNRNHRKVNETLNIIKLDECLDPKNPYRFRMLWFKNSKINKREEQFIVNKIHAIYKTGEDGNTKYDFIACPSTPYINWKSNPYDTCPMCVNAGNYFDAYKETSYKDKKLKRKFDSAKARRVVLIPVYVVKDPNNPKNNGKYGVVAIRERDTQFRKNEETGEWITIDPYETLWALIDAKVKSGIFPYNANGVDLAINVSKIDIENADDNFSYTRISKIQLSKTPYQIDAISTESVAQDEFMTTFDIECWHDVTNADLTEFYDKHIGATVDIPDDDLSDDGIPADLKKQKKSDTVEKSDEVVDNLDLGIDDLDDIDVNMVIDDVIDGKPDTVVEQPKNTTKTKPAEKTDDVPNEIADLDDIDSLISDLDLDLD